jgi:hypothetical protein
LALGPSSTPHGTLLKTFKALTAVPDADSVPVELRLSVADGLGVSDAVPDIEPVSLELGVSDAVPDGELVTLALGLSDPVAEVEAVPLALGLSLAVPDGDPVLLPVGSADTVEEAEGLAGYVSTTLYTDKSSHAPPVAAQRTTRRCQQERAV